MVRHEWLSGRYAGQKIASRPAIHRSGRRDERLFWNSPVKVNPLWGLCIHCHLILTLQRAVYIIPFSPATTAALLLSFFFHAGAPSILFLYRSTVFIQASSCFPSFLRLLFLSLHTPSCGFLPVADSDVPWTTKPPRKSLPLLRDCRQRYCTVACVPILFIFLYSVWSSLYTSASLCHIQVYVAAADFVSVDTQQRPSQWPLQLGDI